MVRLLTKGWKRALEILEFRPWIPMGIHLFCYGLLWLIMGVMIANFMHSRWRILPELSDATKITIEHFCDIIIVTLVVVGIVSLIVCPLVLMVGKRFKAAFHVFCLSLAGILFSVGVTILLSPVFFVLGLEMNKAERAERAARERDWHNTFTFHSEIHRDDGKSPVDWGRSYEYHFVDQVGEEGRKYDFYDCRENKLLLPNVVRWQKVDKQLCLMTRSKELRVLDFESGKMFDYPSSECVTNAALELAFDRLQAGFDKPLQVELDDVKLFASYAELEEWPNLPQIVPHAAKDIMAYCASLFQGEVANARCRLTNEEFLRFVQKHGYRFDKYDLRWPMRVGHSDDDPIFSHFPPECDGRAIGHHAVGFSICEAISPDYKNGAKESLVYVYDSKCEVLWIKYSR